MNVFDILRVVQGGKVVGNRLLAESALGLAIVLACRRCKAEARLVGYKEYVSARNHSAL